MNCTEIDVTPIVSNEGFVPFDLSNNRATLGDNAGALTWQASKLASYWEDLPDGSFAEQGTNVRVALLEIDSPVSP